MRFIALLRMTKKLHWYDCFIIPSNARAFINIKMPS